MQKRIMGDFIILIFCVYWAWLSLWWGKMYYPSIVEDHPVDLNWPFLLNWQCPLWVPFEQALQSKGALCVCVISYDLQSNLYALTLFPRTNLCSGWYLISKEKKPWKVIFFIKVEALFLSLIVYVYGQHKVSIADNCLKIL